MLNLYSVYSASNVRRLCALLCPAIPAFSRPAISCPENWSVNFTSVIFTSSIFSAPASMMMMMMMMGPIPEGPLSVHGDAAATPSLRHCLEYRYRKKWCSINIGLPEWKGRIVSVFFNRCRIANSNESLDEQVERYRLIQRRLIH